MKTPSVTCLFQFTQRRCEALRWQMQRFSRRQIEGFAVAEYPSIEDKEAVENSLKTLLPALHCAADRIIVSIPHQWVSSRYIRLPSQDTKEIEEMIYLQAAKDLPLTREGLTFGHQVVARDADGFSEITMIFARRAGINRIVNAFVHNQLEVSAVYLCTYGIVGFYNAVMTAQAPETIVVGLEPSGMEVAVVRNGKVYLSRSANVQQKEPDWADAVFKQLMETQSLYLRQGPFGPIRKVLLTGDARLIRECKPHLDQKMVIPVEVMESKGLPAGVIARSAAADIPISLLGFMLQQPPETTSLLPKEARTTRLERQQRTRSKRTAWLAALASAMLVTALAVQVFARHSYLGYLDRELAAVKQKAQGLESKVKALRAFRNKQGTGLQVLEFLVAVHEAIPAGVAVNQLRFEAGQEELFVLRGYSEKLDTVFAYASALRSAKVFREGEIKVKQATSQSSRDGEVINLEIAFLHKQ
ncbi:MAG: hypothetical protein PHT59_05340 [Candidatus Omnitrophica bacterium]|nr:hypothetical protein [Candidatus Omnitrophota bacterium]